jgi:hypothetical protein
MWFDKSKDSIGSAKQKQAIHTQHFVCPRIMPHPSAARGALVPFYFPGSALPIKNFIGNL